MKFCYGTLLVISLFAVDIEISFMESSALFNIFSELINLEKCVTTTIQKLCVYIYIHVYIYYIIYVTLYTYYISTHLINNKNN